MPRVAHVISTPAGAGGAERIVAALVRGAQERGWESAILNPFGRERSGSALERLTAPAPFEAYPCDHIRGLPGLRRWLRRALEDLRPDIVHAHLFHAAVAVASVSPPASASTVLTHHHGDHLVYSNQRLSARLDRWAGCRFDRVVAISEAMQRFLRRDYGYRDESIALIRNGWEGAPRPHVGAEHPTVICVGNFRRQKGHFELLEAFAAVREAIRSARLVLIGDGPLRREIEARAARLGVADAVEMRSSEAVWDELARAHVFALASLYEPLGIAVIEAMAAGLPIVASRVGGIPELVGDRAGELVEPAKPQALAAAIERLLRSPAARRSAGEAGRARAKNLPMSRTVSSYYELYEELAAERP